ncbi:hypothetical protein K439DRAFT_1529160 [Ramaria rubella]|nr:hypothetical protein K439DRAFT_1529160 [Ramaria rubella]
MSDLIIDGVAVVSESILTYNTEFAHLVAASMFIFWDYVLTFGDEVNFIWRPKQNGVSILFYVIRYLTFFIRIIHLIFCTNVFGMVHISASGCLLWQWFQLITGQLLFLSVEILLIMRTFAFYGRNRPLLAALAFLLVGELAAMLALISITLPTSQIKANPLSDIHAGPCIGVYIVPTYSSLWIPPLIVQGTLSILIAARFIKTRLNAQIGDPPLLKVFVRDHTWAFVLIFAVSLWTVLAYQLTIDQGEIAITWFYSVLGFCLRTTMRTIHLRI